jgi:MFS family permease
MGQPPPVSRSIWSPLRYPLFRVMWLGMTVSNIGTWMNEVGVTWLMASMAPSNLMVALIQTATTLPFFLLSYPAGVMGDICNRRTVLIALHVWLLVSAVALTALAHQEMTTEWWLLMLTFCLGAGNAMMRPSWSANIPSFAPRGELSNAITLNSLSTNLSKAAGPAIGGLLVASAGPVAVFALNVLSFLFVLATLIWRHPRAFHVDTRLPPETFSVALRGGLRYTRHDPELRAVLMRCATSFVFISVFWSMLPVIVLREMGSSPQTYGLLVGTTGIGSLLGANLLPLLLRRLTRNQVFGGASMVFALALLAIAFTRDYALLALLGLGVGICWIMLFSSLVVASQATAPPWVMARVLALVMLVYGGSVAAGSALWGWLSDVFSVQASISVAVSGMLLSLLLGRRYPIPQEGHRNLGTAAVPMLAPAPELDLQHGPLLVNLDYPVSDGNRASMRKQLERLRLARLRAGAECWQARELPGTPEILRESFRVPSWLAYLRLQERLTAADRMVESELETLAGGPPVLRHLALDGDGSDPSQSIPGSGLRG